MEWWVGTQSTNMPTALAQELMAYASALSVMQSLEGQHHYLHVHQGAARASLPASLCAALRRRVNPDLRDPRFRQNLEKYLKHIPRLVVCDWDSRKDLIRHVYGFSLDTLHGDVSATGHQLDLAKCALKEAHASQSTSISAAGDREKTIQTEHLNQRMVEGSFYRVRTSGRFIAFQCICLHPTKRSYVQKVCHMGKDIWKDSVAVLVCGAADNAQALGTIECQLPGCGICFILACFICE